MNNKLQTAKNAVTSQAGIKLLKLRKNSPTLMFGLGVAGVVATAVLTARATLRLEEKLDDHQSANEILKAAHEHDPERTDADLKKDLTVNTARTVFAIGRLYAPAVLCGAASIGLLTGSHVTLQRRNAGLTAAYVTLAQGFEEYRTRVRDEAGEQKDLEYMYGSDTKEIYSEGKNGEPKVEQVKIYGAPNGYSRIFNEKNSNWNPTPDYNLVWLRAKQKQLTERLNAQGYLFLNDVYDELEFPRIPDGQVLGWVADAHRRGSGDGYIDFGIWGDDDMLRFMEYLNGHENELLLNFNIDRGPIHHLI